MSDPTKILAQIEAAIEKAAPMAAVLARAQREFHGVHVAGAGKGRYTMSFEFGFMLLGMLLLGVAWWISQQAMKLVQEAKRIYAEILRMQGGDTP